MSGEPSKKMHQESTCLVAGADVAAVPGEVSGEQVSPQSGAVHGPWLKWFMAKLRTTPELLAERHSSPWFVLFLALCFPTMVAGMLIYVLGWGTNWHPFWYFVMIVYSLNILWAPFLLRFSEATVMKQFYTRFWCQTIMTLTILVCIIGMTLSGTSTLFDAWLPFGDVSLTTLANYFQVPGMILSEHVIFVHNLRPTGSVAMVLAMYILIGTRLEEARADIVFGSRMVNAARSGQCPYRGGVSCTPHFLIAGTIIAASVIDYITESVEVHALASIAPHLPLALKQFRANIIKMTCEVSTAAAILFFIFSGMDEYEMLLAVGETPTFRQAEMRRYAWMCIGTTVLAIIHVLFMLLVPESAWARVQLQAQAAARAVAQRMSTRLARGRPSAGPGVKLQQVAPVDPEARVSLDIQRGESEC
eukprot:jgi/Ulvmu1/11645/UM008_0049.1